VDINLTGVWKTVKAAAPAMVERGQGGSIILTSSIAGLIAFPNLAHYTAAEGMKALDAMPVPWVEAVDISNAVLYLASDEARYVTGTTTVIDAGAMAPFTVPHGG
jgi:NAD(P)-dependent dehydrogenase (short-subunit alcohol dehydrogenase family)